MALILAIETSTRLCSVAIGRAGQVLAERNVESERMEHAEKENVLVAEVLAESGTTMSELQAVAVGIGPGSYTGLRIGLSAAKGLCHALGVPIIGLSTLAILCDAAGPLSGEARPMIDARRMEVFTRRFAADGRPVSEVESVVLDDAWARTVGACTVFGDGADKATALWKSHPLIEHLPGIRPLAGAMLRAAEKRFAAGSFDDLAYLVPAYGKDARVTQPAKRQG